MTKKKSKNKNAKLSKKALKKQGAGIDLQQVGATLAGAVVGGVMEAAVERLTQKVSENKPGDDSKNHRHSSNVIKQTAHDRPHPISKLQDAVEEAKPMAKDAIGTVRASAADLTPNLADGLREVAQQPIQQSVELVENQTERVIAGVANAAKNAASALQLDKANKPDKKDKKAKKGKSKKSKKKS